MTRIEDASVGQALLDELKVYFADDPNPQTAGHGLAIAPLIQQSLGQDGSQYWLMSPAEQAAFVFLLSNLRPKVAIEIGTRFGGSLQVLSKFSDRVYSLDIDPEVPQRLEGKFSNVEFVIGPSDQTLPPLLKQIQNDGQELSFVLVDGDHSSEGVKRDINNLLSYSPIVPMYIVMHDSFNPECRAGLKSADWAANEYVHVVELDFVPGTVNSAPAFRGELWGGLSLAILKPYKRQGRFEVTGRAELTYQTVVNASSQHSPRSGVRGFVSQIARALPGK